MWLTHRPLFWNRTRSRNLFMDVGDFPRLIDTPHVKITMILNIKTQVCEALLFSLSPRPGLEPNTYIS